MFPRERHHGIILVADDNESTRELLSSLLTEEGYHVICVSDGEQVLEKISADSIDVAVLDVIMPRKTGFEACLAIKSNPETRLIPVLLLTSLNSNDDRIRGIMCGADDFLCKPVNKHELLARMYSLLRLKQFTDELDNAEAVLFPRSARSWSSIPLLVSESALRCVRSAMSSRLFVLIMKSKMAPVILTG